jgi:hypothetical protein
MAIDAVPHHLAHEPADFVKTGYTVELRHAKRHIVAMSLVDQVTVFLDVGLATARRNVRILRHPLHENLKVTRAASADRDPSLQTYA